MVSLYSGNLKKDYARFCIPCVVNLMVFSIYSIVDGLFVSRYVSSNAMAAVTLSHPFMSLLFSIGIMLAVGGSTMIANALGEKNQEKANAVFSQNLVTTIVLGLILSLVIILLLEPLCMFLGADENTLGHTKDYLGALAPFAISFILEYNMEFLVKTDGNPNLSLIMVITSSLLNIFLDWLFVGVLGQGTFGAAIATGISQTVASAVFLGYILFSKKGLFHFSKFKWRLSLFGRIAAIGAADGSMEILSAILVLLYNRIMVKYFGTDGVAAYGILAYMGNLIFNMTTGTAQGMEPLVSFHKGAREYDNCRTLLKYALFSQLALCVTVFLCCEYLTEPIAGMFFEDTSSAVSTLTVNSLRKYCYAFLLIGFNLVCSGYLTAQCRPWQALIISTCRSVLVQGLLLLLIVNFLDMDLIFWAAPISEGIVTIISFFMVLLTPVEEP